MAKNSEPVENAKAPACVKQAGSRFYVLQRKAKTFLCLTMHLMELSQKPIVSEEQRLLQHVLRHSTA